MKTPPGFAPPALWFCSLHLLAAMPAAQCTSPTFTDINALRADGVVVNGSASVSAIAGNCINLKPG